MSFFNSFLLRFPDFCAFRTKVWKPQKREIRVCGLFGRIKLERLALLSVLDESPWRVALVLVVAEFRGLGGRWVCRVFSVAATTRPRSEPATLRGAQGCCMARINSGNPFSEPLSWIQDIKSAAHGYILVSCHSVRSERSRTEVNVIW